MLPVEGNNCSASTNFRCFRDLPEIIYHSLVEIIFLTPNNLPLEVNCSEHCGCSTGVTYCSSYCENLNFCDLNELHAHAHLFAIATDYGLVREWEGLCIYHSGCLQSELLVLLLDDCCKPGRWIFRLNILGSNLIRLPRGGIRLAYPISSFFKHVVLLLTPEAVSVGTPKTVLASSIWNFTTMLQGVNSSSSCMVKLENIYLRSFRLIYFKKAFLSSGLEILSGLAQQDAIKSIATTQVIADSTEISAEDQEVEESKEETEDMTMNTATEDLFLGEDYMANGGELMYPMLEKAVPTSGNFSVNCSCSGLLYKLPENLLNDIFCRLEDKTLIRLKCICKSWNKLINDTCVPKISALAPLHGFLYTARTINSEEFIEFVPGSCPPAPTTNSPGFVESLFALLPFQPFSEDLLDCCNGLLLFKSDAFEEYYVCNPMTRQCVAIPRNIRRQKPTYAALAFNPSESTHYKVCCFEHSGQGRTRHLSLEIFSSETGDWTYYEMPHKLYKRGDIWVKRCVYLDGKLYRLTFSKLLLCFDLREVNAYAIDIPEKDRCDHWGFVGTSKGRLYYSNGDPSQFSFWMLEDCLNANQWILMYNISINIWDEFPLGRYLSKYKRHHLFKPYAMHPSSEVIFLGTPDMIVSFDLNLRLLLQVCRLQSGKVITSGPFTVFPYTCCMVNLVDFNWRRWGSIHHGSLFKGAENLEEIVMKHSPLQEVADSSETFKKERMFEEQLAIEMDNDDKELENTTESCISRKNHFAEEHEDAKAASSDGVLVMEGNSSRADTCCNIQYKLSYDLLAEILCHLPDKSLGRLKCVCKSWDDVITNVCIPKIAASMLCGFLYFATVNLGFEDPRLFLGYIPHAKPPAPTVDLGFLKTFCPLLPFDAYSDDLLDCCNGLFLFRNHSLQYFVCNPMTKESVVIPKGLSRKRSSYAALAFDPCRSLHYKIVCFNRTLSSLLCLEIFSSETGKWTAHEVPVQHSIQGSEWIRRCANLEGVLYRLSRSKHLLRFDLNTVSVRAIELPGNATIKNLGNIGASGGRLYYSIHDSSRLFVWVLEDRVRCKVDRWILVHNAGISDLAKQELSSKLPNYILSSTFKVYGMHPASRAIFFGTTGAIIRYDIDDKRLEVGHRLEITQPAIEDAYSVFLYTCCMMNLENF